MIAGSSGARFSTRVIRRASAVRSRALVRATASIERPDPAALFPTANEGQERYNVAVDKLAFYQLVVTAGRTLAALGFALMAAGVLHVRIRTLRAPGR